MAKDERYISLIQSPVWKRLRARKLQDDPLCEQCRKSGVIMAATCVHHITPVESVPSTSEMQRLCYDYRNLMSLCNECHAAIHKAMGRSTKQQAKERNEKALIEFKRKYF